MTQVKHDVFWEWELAYIPSNKTSILSQQACTTKMIDTFNQKASSPVYNLSVPGKRLTKCNEIYQDMKKRSHCSMSRSLLYVAIYTRKDAALAICQLSQSLEN